MGMKSSKFENDNVWYKVPEKNITSNKYACCQWHKLVEILNHVIYDEQDRQYTQIIRVHVDEEM